MSYKNQFNKIITGDLSGLELRNFIEQVTELKKSKLILLLNDLNTFYYKKVRKKESQVNKKNLSKAIKQAEKYNPKLIYKDPTDVNFTLIPLPPNSNPLKYLPKLQSINNYLYSVYNVYDDYDIQPLDIEALLFPEKFYHIRQAIFLIKKIINDKEETDKKNKAYGNSIHKENYSWIKKIFEEEKPNHPSQNQTAKKVKDLYKENFGLQISITTILRAVGKVD